MEIFKGKAGKATAYLHEDGGVSIELHNRPHVTVYTTGTTVVQLDNETLYDVMAVLESAEFFSRHPMETDKEETT